MIKRKSTCGLCKPHKKWKKNETKIIYKIKKEIQQEIAINAE